jgi:hypothetical protein
MATMEGSKTYRSPHQTLVLACLCVNFHIEAGELTPTFCKYKNLSSGIALGCILSYPGSKK